ncbi:MAG: adenosylcobinamide-GDP ribazoletransferase [Actinobacteria bacterium]|nr:adenosylcobinamide-GDP ribazoletransferase [Actinomycetota bacterium]
MRFLNAIGFLTIIKISPKYYLKGQDYPKTLVYFPVVGFILGLFASLLFFSLNFILPLFLTVIFIVCVELILTGGIHIDGLADTFDGIFSGESDKTKIRQIMKKGDVGVFGVLAVIFFVAIKTALLYFTARMLSVGQFLAFDSLSGSFYPAFKQNFFGFLVFLSVLIFTPVYGRLSMLCLFSQSFSHDFLQGRKAVADKTAKNNNAVENINKVTNESSKKDNIKYGRDGNELTEEDRSSKEHRKPLADGEPAEDRNKNSLSYAFIDRSNREIFILSSIYLSIIFIAAGIFSQLGFLNFSLQNAGLARNIVSVQNLTSPHGFSLISEGLYGQNFSMLLSTMLIEKFNAGIEIVVLVTAFKLLTIAVITFLFAAAAGRFFRKRVGRISGDVFGAVCVLTEVFFLLLNYVFIKFV